MTFSGLCNPNLEFFYGGYNYSYETAENAYFVDFCSFPVRDLVKDGHIRTLMVNLVETWLQCPQCGRGAEGAANLNDLYTMEQIGSRKVSNAEQFINATITNNV